MYRVDRMATSFWKLALRMNGLGVCGCRFESARTGIGVVDGPGGHDEEGGVRVVAEEGR